MKLTLEFNQVDNKNILLLDKTRWGFKELPASIYSILMDIESVNVVGGTVYNLDVLDYMRTKRVDYELYRITSETLGLRNGADIPDGIYRITIRVNNLTTTKYDIVVINEIQSEMKRLAGLLGEGIDVTDTSISINTSVSNNITSKWLYVLGVYGKLMLDLGIPNNLVAVNNDIDKLQRLLTIVKTMINE